MTKVYHLKSLELELKKIQLKLNCVCLCAVIYLPRISVLLFISWQLRLQHFDVSTCSIKSRRLVTFWIQMSN